MQACTCGQDFTVSISWESELPAFACTNPRSCFGTERAEPLAPSQAKRIDVAGTALVVLAGAAALVSSAVHYLI